jgi:DNA-binding helix-hairpin-helix protein with protein kinase domain
MSNLAKLHTATGQKIMVGKQLGRGGEGAVFAIEGCSGLAAKIYHEDKRACRSDKIVAITSSGLHATAANVAFPIDLVLDQREPRISHDRWRTFIAPAALSAISTIPES